MDYRQKLDGDLQQLLGSMWNIPLECERIARFQTNDAITVTVIESTLQHVDEFHARVLKARKYFALIVQRDEKGFEEFARSLIVGQQLIGVTPSRAAPNDLHALPRRDMLRKSLGQVVVLEDL